LDFNVDIPPVPIVPYELQWHITEAVKQVTQDMGHCRATKQTYIGHLNKL